MTALVIDASIVWDGAARLAIELDHPAYDCIYLALALERGVPFVTADQRLLRRAAQSAYASSLLPLGSAMP